MLRFIRNWLIGAAITLIAAGAAMSYLGKHLLRGQPPTRPPAWEAKAAKSGTVPVSTARPLKRAEPVRIWIPKIHVWARISPRGLRRSGTVGVPSLKTPFLTTWFDRGPAPGQRGTAAIYGHVDAQGPAVFYRLGSLRPDDLVYVTLASSDVAIFRVYSVAMYAKDRFPTATVYRYTHWPTLRLITCGGRFDPSTHHYLSNVVVFASYVGARR
ncbi:MAG TPA: class F sortase [Streptosporangiaceae bacterium]